MNDMQQILFILALYVPAAVANMAPVFASRYNMLLWLNKPIDLGITIRGRRLLGENKTIRGIVVGVATAGIFGILLSFVIDVKPYDSYRTALVYSMAVGLGALMGDSVKSFFKRRLNIKSGELWIPFDQIDFAIGATVVILFFVDVPFYFSVIAIIFIGLLSFIISKIGFALHIKKNL